MPEFLTPGVYVEEVQRGPRPIEGVATSTAAFLGETERGPVCPRLVTSFKEYLQRFGGTFGDDKYLPYAAAGFFDNGGKRLYVCRIVRPDATPAEASFGEFAVRAVGPGSWGRRVWVNLLRSSGERPGPNAGDPSEPVGFRLRMFYWSNVPQDFQPFDPDAEPGKLPRPTLTEDFDNLVIDANAPDHVEKFLFENSALATLVRTGGATPDSKPEFGQKALTEGGEDDDAGPLTTADYHGLPIPGTQRIEVQGLEALKHDRFRDVAIVYAPGVEFDIAQKLVEHCEEHKFRFAVLDCKKTSSTSQLHPRTLVGDTSFGAFYFPWVYVNDFATGARKLVPPGGHVVGVYARTDTERGVFKAPANETPRGVIDLEFDIDDESQGELNPKGVNVIRRFAGRGIRIWGARTMSSNGLWKYVSVRRLFIFLERSIYEGTRWAVFEPNDPRLWARVTDTVRLFLSAQWRQGALSGRTEEQAFFVACNETTMTQDDILNGRLVCEIGIAPVRPAEFVIFRIFQNTAEAQR